MFEVYTVIWRCRQDDYDWTVVEVAQGCAPKSPMQWVILAALKEYEDDTKPELAEILHNITEGYELLDVLHGVAESAL